MSELMLPLHVGPRCEQRATDEIFVRRSWPIGGYRERYVCGALQFAFFTGLPCSNRSTNLTCIILTLHIYRRDCRCERSGRAFVHNVQSHAAYGAPSVPIYLPHFKVPPSPVERWCHLFHASLPLPRSPNVIHLGRSIWIQCPHDLWGKQAENFNLQGEPIIAFKESRWRILEVSNSRAHLAKKKKKKKKKKRSGLSLTR